MTWAVVSADGLLLSLHGREEGARMNAGEGAVVPIPERVAARPHGYQYSPVTGRWRSIKPEPAAALDHASARRLAYGQQIDTDLQFEAIFEALLALATPEVRAANPAAFARLDAIGLKVAAIKAQHPKGG